MNRFFPTLFVLACFGLFALVAFESRIVFGTAGWHGSGGFDVSADERKLATATFGSGCFWCTESDFDKVEGVVATVSGYMGGKTESPTYKSVSTGRTGHAESLQVTYDPSVVSYQMLLDYYWRHTDVLDGGGQFCDRGSQYRPVIFTHTPEQARLAADGKKKLDASGRFNRPIAVEIAEASEFTRAEAYHQDYYLKHPAKYRRYRYGCGRDQRLRQLWGAPATH